MGPAVADVARMEMLVKAGMNVARLNFSHGTHPEHRTMMDKLKSIREKLGVPLAIMLDTKGPELRVKKIKGGAVTLQTGSSCRLTGGDFEGNEEIIAITPSSILGGLSPGMSVLFDDGYISAKVTECLPEEVVIHITHGGVLKSGKGLSIPEATFNLPTLTPQDIDDIRFGCKEGIDMVAASFVRTAEDVVAIKKILEAEGKAEVLVIAKIENREGVKNFDAILQVADGIMIARGDLGVQVPLSEVPRLQKMMIRKCYLAGKPAVTATQMLESMIKNPRPTRAEASDVANAIYDSTAAVMLSGETAVGDYPIEAVRVMKEIVGETENDFNYRDFFAQHSPFMYNDIPFSVTLAAVKTGYSANAKAIFAFTSRGGTARLLSRLRPSMPIIAYTSDIKTFHQLSINWGVVPILGKEVAHLQEALSEITSYALQEGIVSCGDSVIVTAGAPFGVSGTTNMMMVEIIGQVLVQGHAGIGDKKHGKVVFSEKAEETSPYKFINQFIVMSSCGPHSERLIEASLGIILQNDPHDIASESYALSFCQKHKKPCIVRASSAMNILKEGQLITLDPEKAVVYKGVVL